jgi:hypothetical protein
VGVGVIDSVPAGEGSTVLTSSEIGGASGSAVATRESGEAEVVAEAALAVDAEAGGAESEADAGTRRPSSARASAKTDGPKNTNSMATATLTSLPLT